MLIGFIIIKNRETDFIKILDKYRKKEIIEKTIDINSIDKINEIVNEIYNGNEEYIVYNYQLLINIIENINNDIIHKKLLIDDITLDNFYNDLIYIKNICKKKINKNMIINMNKNYVI